MDASLSKYFLYYPATLLKGELVLRHLHSYSRQQYMTYEEQLEYKRKRILEILNFSIKYSPYYRKTIGLSDFNDISRREYSTLPFLTKSNLIDNLEEIATYKARYSSTKTTGGSTGEPVKLYKNPDALARERAATWRSYGWAGISVGDKQARFWGVPHQRLASYKARVTDFISNRYRISAFSLSESSLNKYYFKLMAFKPKYLYGYISVILALTKFVEAQGLRRIPSLRCIITTSEVLTEGARSEIERVWGVKVFNEYGCGEVGSVAHECEYGRLHVVADNLNLEIIDNNGQQSRTGQIVVTDYFNQATPLIRYKLGDYASIEDDLCPCGRTLPVLKNVHGRAYDIIKTPSGREVHPEAVIYIFENLQRKTNAFSQFQVVQERAEKLKINIVRTHKWHDELLEVIGKEMRKHIDPLVACEFQFCDSVPRESSGKMRVVKSLVSK